MKPRVSPSRIACALCVGAAPEPYLAATLRSLEPAVDALVVNDNSGIDRSANVAAIEDSAFSKDGRLHLMRTRFVDFADMRNRAQEALSSLEPSPEWVLFIDADEVHGAQVRYLAREVLPRLPPSIVQIDAYTYHFWGTFGWITDIARRMVFYRFSRGLRWENPVHEKLAGLRGRRVVVPYIYHHYGNVLPPRLLAEKHQRYYRLGNPVPAPPDPDAADLQMYLARAAEVRPFRGKHPLAALGTVEAIRLEASDAFAKLDAGFRERRTALVRARTSAASLNELLRVRLRAIEHPLLFRAPVEAV